MLPFAGVPFGYPCLTHSHVAIYVKPQDQVNESTQRDKAFSMPAAESSESVLPARAKFAHQEDEKTSP